MSGEVVKIRLRAGTREIELEGARHNVDQLLERWWQAGPSDDAEQDEKLPHTRSKPHRQVRASDEESDDASFDVNEVANSIKECDDFSTIEKKVLHVARDPYNKVALVLWFVKQPLTSGEVHRVLQALNLRIDLSNVSKTLKKYLRQFTTSQPRTRGGGVTRYQLTAKAQSDFQNWLRNADGK